MVADRNRAFLESVMDAVRQSDCPVSLCDASDPAEPSFLNVSEGFEDLTGYSQYELFGKTGRTLSTGCLELAATDFVEKQAAVEPGGMAVHVCHGRRKTGELFECMVQQHSLILTDKTTGAPNKGTDVHVVISLYVDLCSSDDGESLLAGHGRDLMDKCTLAVYEKLRQAAQNNGLM